MVCKAGQLAWQALDNGTQKVFVKPLGNSASNLISAVLKDTIEEKSNVECFNLYHYSNGPHRPTRRSLRHSVLIYIEYACLLIIVIMYELESDLSLMHASLIVYIFLTDSFSQYFFFILLN